MDYWNGYMEDRHIRSMMFVPLKRSVWYKFHKITFGSIGSWVCYREHVSAPPLRIFVRVDQSSFWMTL